MEEIKTDYNIVIVDDEPIITSSLKTLLMLEGDYSPKVFNNPVEALEYIKQAPVDLVISDFFMPEMNGIELLKEVKNLYAGATLILLTGYADKENAIRGINEVGLYRYLEKPWDNEDLLLCVKNGLERSHLIENLEFNVYELEQAKNKLELYNEYLEQMAQKRTDELVKSREDFVATLAHDLRTPLLAAIQTLRFFLDGTLGELGSKQKTLLETMMLSNQDMLGLVNALLEVYKYEAGQLVLCKDYFNLRDFITHCTQEIKPLLEKKNLELYVKNVPDEKIYADKQEIRRVFANLLGNALNYTPTDGKITVSCETDKENILISVKDTGMGIPKEDIPKLFKRFSQGTSQKRSTGTGLGLYLSRQIVEAHGGKIWLESELGYGSKFIFAIPRQENL